MIAMAGFIGNLQLILFLRILYVVAADELIDSLLTVLNERVIQLLRVLLLPSSQLYEHHAARHFHDHSVTEPSCTEMTESQAKGLGALVTSLLTLFLTGSPVDSVPVVGTPPAVAQWIFPHCR